MKLFFTIFFFCSCIIFYPIPLYSQSSATIIINVTNIPTSEGLILAALQRGLYYKMENVSDTVLELTFSDIPYGRYDLSVFHDANSNWRLDKKKHIPIEYCAIKEIVVSDSSKCFDIRLDNQSLNSSYKR